MNKPTEHQKAAGSPPPPTRITRWLRRLIGAIIGAFIGLLFLASLVAWYQQDPPPVVARQYLSEQLAVAPNDLELVGHSQGFPGILGIIWSQWTVEFRVKGSESSTKRVVELTRWVYFLPWRATGLREVREKQG
jgi:hypothetical protein